MRSADVRRYAQLGVLILAAGAIYPLLYLRQNFEGSMLEAFDVTNTQLGQCYSLLGIMFMATYLPSGWLADRIQPRVLLGFSLLGTGLLGLWYWTLPGFVALQVIFAGWGITTGLTFWAALIKETNLIARHDEQGRFFGMLEGGRGIVEAVLASIVVAWFAWTLSRIDADTTDALQQVIFIYVVVLLLMAPLVFFSLGEAEETAGPAGASSPGRGGTLEAARIILGKREVWLAGACILCGYQLFYATYSFAGFLQNELAASAVAVGWITLARQWMRPVGAIASGFIGDRFQVERVLGIMLLGSSAGLGVMIFLPASAGIAVTLLVVLTVAVLTYAVRGIYWSTLDDCRVPVQSRGLAIGIISAIGYSPEIYAPYLNGYLVDNYPGRTGYAMYYGSVALMGLLGALAAFRLMKLNRETRAQTVARASGRIRPADPLRH